VGEDLADAIPSLRAKLRRLARDLRFEDAARLRDRLAALEDIATRVAELDRLRRSSVCVLAPSREPGFTRAFVVAGGRVSARTLPAGLAGKLEVEACLAEAARAEPSLAPEDADRLLVVSGFLRRPGPELRIVSLDAARILAA
jgi:excinuclease UvrABC nuclease subunit